jgi:hypothetical protein
VTATKGGVLVGAGQSQSPLAPGCTAITVALAGAIGDMAVPVDLRAEDLAAADRPADLSVVDQAMPDQTVADRAPDLTVVDLAPMPDLITPPVIGAPKSNPVGGMPRWIASGDLSGDGILDLAVSVEGTNQVQVLLGKGGGAFATGGSYTVPSHPVGIAVGDLDGDGKPDVAVAGYGGASAYVLINTGSAMLAPPKSFPTGMMPHGIALFDLNADGKLDILTADNGSATVSVLLNTTAAAGMPAFAAAVPYMAGSAPTAVATGDFNGDCLPDAVVTLGSANAVAVLLGKGGGVLGPAVTYPVGMVPLGLALGDLNGDGHLDIATGNEVSNDVTVLFGKPDGTFMIGSTYGAGLQPYWVSIGDMNSDGSPDLVVASIGDNVLTVLQGSPTGAFSRGSTYATGKQPMSIALGDWTGDGKLDVATANNSGGDVSVLFNLTAAPKVPTFAAPVAYADGLTMYGPAQVITADLNKDGFPDVVVDNYISGSPISVLLNKGNGTFAPFTAYPAWNYANSIVAVDLDGDGYLDIANCNDYSSQSHTNVQVLLNNKMGGLAAPVGYNASTWNGWITSADFNGDGKPDIVTTSYANGFNGMTGNINVFLNTGNGILGADTQLLQATQPGQIAAADFNGDGRADLAVNVGKTPAAETQLLLGDGKGNFAAPIGVASGCSSGLLNAVDVNADGQLDIVLSNTGFWGTVSVLVNRGGAFPTFVSYPVGAGPGWIVPADYNGDGKVDLAVGTSGGVIIMNNNGASFDAPLYIWGPTGPFTAGDLNGDKKPDLVSVDAKGNANIFLNTTP